MYEKLNKRVTLLWDLDGTLLTTRGSGAPAFQKALEEISSSVVNFERKKYAGWTDHQIAHHHLKELRSVSELEASVEAALQLYAQLLTKSLTDRNTSQIDNVEEKLQFLRLQYKEFDHHVLTGNTFPCAIIKLKACGLYEHFKESRFFCSQRVAHRSEIAIRAKAELASSQTQLIIVGDTLRDIECGIKANIPVIAVNPSLMSSLALQEVDYNSRLIRFINNDWRVDELREAIFELV